MESKASINSVIFTILKYQVKWTKNTNNNFKIIHPFFFIYAIDKLATWSSDFRTCQTALSAVGSYGYIKFTF